jgi:signal transduction histidine kinase
MSNRPQNATFGPRLSLAAQLMLLIGVLSLGPLVVTNYHGYDRSRQLIAELSLQTLQHTAWVGATETDSFIDERRRLINSLAAGNVHMVEATREAAALVDAPADEQPALTALERHLRAKAAGVGDDVALYVLSPQAVVLGSSLGPAERGQHRPDDGCLQAAGNEESGSLRRQDSSKFFVAAPLPELEGASKGVLCGRFDFVVYEELDRIALAQSPVQRISILDSNATTLADIGASRTPPDVLERVVAQRAEPGQVWTGTDHEGPTRFVSVVPLRSADWLVVAEVLESEALVVLDDLKRRVVWMGSIFVLLVILGMIVMVKKTIAPLRDLLGATRNMTRGQLAQRVDSRGPREVAELADVFNQMSRHVAELHDTLEERVAQRTEELHRNKAFTELLFDSLEENLVVLDADARIIDANQTALCTYGEDIVGRHASEVLGEAWPSRDNRLLLEELDAEQPLTYERVHTCGGKPEIMSLQLFLLPPSERDGGQRVLMVSRKITDEKQQHAHEVHGEKVSAYALMAASVAHEIGNPLSSISAQLQLARRKDDPDFTERVLEIIDQEVERISRLLRDITDFAGRQSRRPSLVCWNRVAQDAVRLLRHDPRGRFAEFELDLQEDLASVTANPDHCLQVLINLGLNGLDAMDGRGTLTVETALEDDQVLVRVVDQGPGVAPELREQIFEPYFSTKDQPHSTGLGLFISRRVVEQMGGQLDVEDTDDAGATFVIRMPVDAQPHRPGSTTAPAGAEHI